MLGHLCRQEEAARTGASTTAPPVFDAAILEEVLSTLSSKDTVWSVDRMDGVERETRELLR